MTESQREEQRTTRNQVDRQRRIRRAQEIVEELEIQNREGTSAQRNRQCSNSTPMLIQLEPQEERQVNAAQPTEWYNQTPNENI